MTAGRSKEPRGWEFADLVWEMTPNGKLIFFSKQEQHIRYQLNLSGTSEVLDIHKTIEHGQGRKTHETIFAMKMDDLPRLLEDVGKPFFDAFMQLHRPVHPGWLYRYRVVVLSGLIPNEAEARRLAHWSRNRLVLDAEVLMEHLAVREWDEASIGTGNGDLFAMVRLRTHGPANLIGVAFRVSNESGNQRLRWISLRDVETAISSQIDLF
jgi:hypothetical protein